MTSHSTTAVPAARRALWPLGPPFSWKLFLLKDNFEKIWVIFACGAGKGLSLGEEPCLCLVTSCLLSQTGKPRVPIKVDLASHHMRSLDPSAVLELGSHSHFLLAYKTGIMRICSENPVVLGKPQWHPLFWGHRVLIADSTIPFLSTTFQLEKLRHMVVVHSRTRSNCESAERHSWSPPPGWPGQDEASGVG